MADARVSNDGDGRMGFPVGMAMENPLRVVIDGAEGNINHADSIGLDCKIVPSTERVIATSLVRLRLLQLIPGIRDILDINAAAKIDKMESDGVTSQAHDLLRESVLGGLKAPGPGGKLGCGFRDKDEALHAVAQHYVLELSWEVIKKVADAECTLQRTQFCGGKCTMSAIVVFALMGWEKSGLDHITQDMKLGPREWLYEFKASPMEENGSYVERVENITTVPGGVKLSLVVPKLVHGQAPVMACVRGLGMGRMEWDQKRVVWQGLFLFHIEEADRTAVIMKAGLLRGCPLAHILFCERSGRPLERFVSADWASWGIYTWLLVSGLTKWLVPCLLCTEPAKLVGIKILAWIA